MFKKESYNNNLEKYTIDNGDYSVSILNKGATLQSFKCKDIDIVLGYDNPNDYLSNDNYFGQVVGPFANRIKNATYTDKLGVHILEKNDGNNSLHSGSKNYGYKLWSLKEHGDDYLILSLKSLPEGGFPSTEDIEVRYSLSSDGTLKLDYEIKSDMLCPANITNHAFFNLDGEGTIKNHTLTIPASHYLAVDSELIPIGVTSCIGNDFDFNSMRVVSSRRNGAYDHCFILDNGKDIVLEGKSLRMTVNTDLPAVQLYTGEFIKSNCRGKNGIEYGAFSALCLETEYYPDFVSNKTFKGAWVDKDNPIRTTTTFKLEKK